MVDEWCTREILLFNKFFYSASTGNTLWRVWTVFTRSAITAPEVNQFGWNLRHRVLWVHCLPLVLEDFGCDRRRSQSERASRNFVFLSGKQHAISPTSGQRNFAKFAHNMWICVAMNPFGTKFWKFTRKGSFFSKNATFLEKSWTTSDFRPP